MFCTNCGAQIGENEKFCSNCGARQATEKPVEQMAAVSADVQMSEGDAQATVPADVAVEAEQGATIQGFSENTDAVSFDMPKKKKGIKKKAIIAAVVAGALVATSGLAALVSPTVRNTFAKTLMSEQKYFKYVQKQNAKELAESFADLTSFYKDYLSGNLTTKGEVEVILEKEGMQFVAENADISEAEVAEVFDALQEFSVRTGFESNVKGYHMDGVYTLNGKELIRAETTADMENGDVYIGLPGVTNKVLHTEIDDAIGGSYQEALEMLKQVCEILPDEEVLERLIVRYWECIANSVTDVKESSVTLEAGDMSQKCVQQKVKITEKQAMKSAKAVLQEAKSDSDLKKIITKAVETMGGDPDETYTAFKSGIEMALKSMDSSSASSESVGNLLCWIDGKGDLLGVGFEMNEDMGDGKISLYSLEKGNKFGTVISGEYEGKKIALEGSGTTSGGKRNGSYKLNVLGTNYVEITFTDVDEKKYEDGMFDGKMVIAPTAEAMSLIKMAAPDEVADLLDGLKLEFENSQSDAMQSDGKMTFYVGNKPLFTVKAKSNVEKRTFTVPSVSGRYVDMDDYDALEEFGEEVQDALLDNLRDAGLPIPEEAPSEEMAEMEVTDEMVEGFAFEKEPPVVDATPKSFGIGKVIQ